MEAANHARDKWLRAGEVSDLFEAKGLFPVPRSTLRDWAVRGRIASTRTPGGQRRYRESDALALLATLDATA